MTAAIAMLVLMEKPRHPVIVRFATPPQFLTKVKRNVRHVQEEWYQVMTDGPVNAPTERMIWGGSCLCSVLSGTSVSLTSLHQTQNVYRAHHVQTAREQTQLCGKGISCLQAPPVVSSSPHSNAFLSQHAVSNSSTTLHGHGHTAEKVTQAYYVLRARLAGHTQQT